MSAIKIIVRPRMTGKTTELIRRAAETGWYIVCTDRRRASEIFRQAQVMGLSIPFPMTAREWQAGDYYRPGVRGLAFDDLDRIVQHLSSAQVFAATWTAEWAPDGDPGDADG